MIYKQIDLNCSDSDYFEIEFDEQNYAGITTDQDMFARWIKDLRSGKYTQLRETLYEPTSDTSYCALGVLCKKRIKRLRQDSVIDNSKINNEILLDDIKNHIPDYFTNIFIFSEHGYRYNTFDFLIELNDYCQLSFVMIADIMEAIHLEIRGEDNTKLLSRLSNNQKWPLSAI